MKFLKLLLFLIMMLNLISCSEKEEKISLIKENNLEMQMIEAYNEGLKEFNKVHLFEEALLKAALLAKKAKEDSGKKDLIIAGSMPSKGIVYSAQKMLDEKDGF